MSIAKNLSLMRSLLLCLGWMGLSTTFAACSSPPKSKNTDLSGGTGTLTFVANGEDFVRKGFVTKDQWQISFDHVYVTLDQVRTVAGETLIYGNTIKSGSVVEKGAPVIQLPQPITVDLAMGDNNAEPIVLESVSAPAARYSNLAWNLVPATAGPAKGASLLLQGTATKQGQTLPFTLKLNPKLQFQCGDFVGEERKGILKPDGTAELEATFHFDHIFGDGQSAPEEDVNQGALGFEPFAKIAQGGKVELDWTTSTPPQKLPPEQASQLQNLMPTLGHVGEGHCEAATL